MVSAVLLLLAAQTATTPPVPAAPAADRPFVAEKKWAICVGAEEYKDLAPLKYAGDDAQLFARTLVEGYGFETSTVSVITDGGGEGAPTSAKILGEVRRRLSDRQLDRGDLFVFYFSGHGVGTVTGDYLMPVDVAEKDAETKGVAVKSLIGAFVEAGLKNVLVIADACRSGKKNPFGNELQILGRKANIAVLLGCAPGQRSYEYPRLEHGIFTHFLVKSMADRSLTDPGSGALWASAVAGKAAANVKSYTEADYGDDAQVPVAWSEPSQDVLLAAFPALKGPSSGEPAGAGGNHEFQAGLEKEAGKLDRRQYARYLSGIGRTLAREGRTGEAIQAFKTLDGLGLAEWRDLSELALALSDEGREKEIGLLTARAAREPKPTDQSEMVILHGRPDYVGPERFARAVTTATRPETYGFRGAVLRTTLLRDKLHADDARVARELAPFVGRFPKDSFETRFIDANVALGERRYAEALALAETADAMPEAKLYRTVLRQIRYFAAERVGDGAKVDAAIREGTDDPSDTFPWITARLSRMKGGDNAKLLEAAKAFAHATDSELRMGELLVLLGADAGLLREDAARIAQKHPYAWKAHVNLWLAGSVASGFLRVPLLSEAAFKYGPARSDVVQYALGRWDQTLQTASRDGRVDGTTTGVLRDQIVGAYARYWTYIEDDPVALFQMGLALARTNQSVRGATFAREWLWPYAQKQSYVRGELMTTCLLLALNGADEATARAVFAQLEKESRLGATALVRYAMHQALDGNAEEAERAMALWPTLGQGAPPEPVAGTFAALRALLAVRRGDRAKATAFLKDVKRIAPGTEIAVRLAHYELVGASAFPELANRLLDADAGSSDLQAGALASIVRSYAKDETPSGRTRLHLFSYLLTRRAGHPWVQSVGYRGKDGIEHWAGETRWSGTISDGMSRFPCTMVLRVDASGKAKGELVVSETAHQAIEGRVDRFGNLTAKIRDENQELFVPEETRNKNGSPFASFTLKLPTTAAAGEKEVQELGRFYASIVNSPWAGSVVAMRPTGSTPLSSPPTALSRRTHGPVGALCR